MNTIVIPSKKPRNPYVVLARARRAGSHGSRRDLLEKALLREERKYK